MGGILEYIQSVPGTWVLAGNLQLDNFSVTSATESGSTVTITTSSPTDFVVGQSVSINGVQLAAYDGTVTVTSVSGSTFTYTANFTGLANSSPGVFGAFATGADGGIRALAADFTDNGANDGKAILYVTTSGTSGNRLEEITGGTLDDMTNANFQAVNLGTAAPGTALRGVAFEPTRPGTTASTTSLTASGNTLTATVTSGATGWVEFFQANGSYIGTAFINSSHGVAERCTTGVLPANNPPGSSYNVFAVYTGNNTFASSTSATVSDTVGLIATSTGLTFSPTTVGTNQSDTLTATINVPTGQSPTGLVTFTNTTNSTVLGVAQVTQVIQNVNGLPVITFIATLTVPAGTFTAGTYNISAAYSGDGYFAASTTSGSLSVVKSTTTTVTSSLANPTANTGQALTLTAAVTSTAGGTPGGTVQFYDDTLALGGPVTVNGVGVATLTVNTTLVQSVTILSASANASGVVTITTDANNPMTVGESVTIEGVTNNAFNGTFTVTGVSGNTFTYQGQFHGAASDAKGGLAIGLNVLTPGLHSISAVYTPTGASLSSFAGSTGVHEQTVQGLAFGASDIFVERNGDGISPLNTRSPNPVLGSIGTTIYIDELTSSGALVQSFILPSADSQAFSILGASESGTTVTITTVSPNDYAVGQKVTIAGVTSNPTGYNGDFIITGVSGNTFTYTAAAGLGAATVTGATATGVVHAVVGDGQQSTTGQMSLSGDGQDLFLTGYDNNPLPFGTALPVPTGTGSANVPRSVAQISFNGTVQTEAFNVGTTGINTGGVLNGVYSPDGNQFYLSGFNGIYYFPSVVTSASLQGSQAQNQIDSTGFTINGLESYAGNLYAIGTGNTTGTANRIQQVGVGMPKADVSAITGASWAGGLATITANNDYVVGQSVTVAGVTGTSGGNFNGTFSITGATGTSFSYALGTAPTGTPVVTGATASLQATLTQLPGIPVNSTTEPVPIFFPVDAYFTHTNGAGAALDTIYIADDGKSFGGGDITKWSLTSVNISSITESGTTATVTLSAPGLGLATGEVVNLTLAGNAPAAYNGAVSVTVTSPTAFTFTTTAGAGTSTTNRNRLEALSRTGPSFIPRLFSSSAFTGWPARPTLLPAP